MCLALSEINKNVIAERAVIVHEPAEQLGRILEGDRIGRDHSPGLNADEGLRQPCLVCFEALKNKLRQHLALGYRKREVIPVAPAGLVVALLGRNYNVVTKLQSANDGRRGAVVREVTDGDAVDGIGVQRRPFRKLRGCHCDEIPGRFKARERIGVIAVVTRGHADLRRTGFKAGDQRRRKRLRRAGRKSGRCLRTHASDDRAVCIKQGHVR